MKWFSARTRMTVGLACLLVSTLCTAMMIGMVPERHSAMLAGRARMCETIAMSSSDYISRAEMRHLEHLLKSVVTRNYDVLSAGVRKSSGALIIQVGDHVALWQPDDTERSTETHVHVPIRAGHDKWGSIELRFLPLKKQGLAGYWEDPWMRMTLFIGSVSYVLFFVYLGKMLQHLDPSKTVPQRVRTALDSLAEGLLVIDRDQRIVLANQAFSDWVGRPPDKMIGVHAATIDWVKNHQGEPLESYPWVEAIKLETPQAGVMLGLAPNPSGAGGVRVLMANASPVLGHDGQYRGVLVSFDDVTKLEETRKDLKVAKQAAENANQAKSDFLARMSHEIRTPMNAILGYTDVMRRGFDKSTQERQEYLDTIHGSGEHLLALINDILDLSKIEAGRMELDLQRVSPHQLIAQVVSMLRSKADEKGIELKFECNDPLPQTILIDEVRLRQTIMNLAGNAIKFTDQGSVRIVARLEEGISRDGLAKTMFAIDVVDTGIGISPEVQKQIFDPFSQADSSITRRFGGTGVGLAISRQLAEAMGGQIGVTSVPGKGSTFTVTIDPGPLEGIALMDAHTALSHVEQLAVETTKQTVQLPPARVLVADDGESNRKLVKLVLERAGVDVVGVENGRLAVERAVSERFDVILMDMQMPVMDGYAATRTLRKSGYQRPIIALTAHAMQEDEDKCRAAGCSEFLAKPINIDRLLAKLAAVLGEMKCEISAHPTELTVGPAADNSATTVRPPVDEMHERTSSEKLLSEATDPIECSFPLEDPDFREIAEEFVERLEEKLAAMQQAWEARDFDELASLAHWLKGSGGTAGFDAFTAPAKTLEQLAKQRNGECIPSAIEALRQLAGRIALPVPTE